MAYDTRAWGDFGWTFLHAGEHFRKLQNVPQEDKLMICGIFKQATMGDCMIEAAKKGNAGNDQREEWLKHKGVAPIDAMQMYIDKVKELAQIYPGPDD